MADKPVVQQVVVGAVVVYGGKVLILQRSMNETVYPGLWELPSGKKEPLETSEEALVREVKEETGLIVKVNQSISVFSYQVEKPEVIRDSTQINFLVEITNGNTNVKGGTEHQVVVWINESEIDNYKFSDETKDTILRAFKLMKGLN